MPSLAFEAKFEGYLGVASLSIMLWDILDNIRNDYRLLFHHRPIGFPTIIHCLSRISVLGFILVSTIFLTTSSIACKTFEATFIGFYITGLVSTLYLSYIRVCAVWHWNRFIMGFFCLSWLAVVASSFTLINSIHVTPGEGDYCIIRATPRILAPFITSLFNHAVVFLAITYGVCRNTIGRDLTFRDCIQLMLGKNLPTFSKALLHDSQICYIIMTVIAAATIVWFQAWTETDWAFRLALVLPYLVLVNMMICRVFRNTKLGLYKKVPVQSNLSKTHTTTTLPIAMASWNSRHESTDDTVTPIQIAVSKVVEYKRDYSSSRHAVDYLDFGMV